MRCAPILPSLAAAVALCPAGPAGAEPQRPPARPTPAPLVRLEVTPATLELTAGEARSRRVLLTGHYADGISRDFTAAARWSSTRPQIAVVAPGGRVTARDPGSAEIQVEVGGRRAVARVQVSRRHTAPRWSYSHQIAPLLTRLGCNGGSCHGAPAGKGGLRLSLFNADPAADYLTLAKEGHGRRVTPQEPGQSLLLRKATLQVPHRGGRRTTPASPEYETLLRWIAAGAPADDPEEPRAAALQVLPAGRVLPRPGETQQLVVLVRFSNGEERDVTEQATFASNDEGVATVDSGGIVTAVGQGEAPILVRWAGLVTAAVVGATTRAPVRDFPAVHTANPVDRWVFPKLRALRVRPSEPASDSEFLRRAYLDLTATLPTAAEARAFLGDTRPDRRARLIDTLLERPEYADYQAFLWAERLRSNSRFHRIGGVRSYQKWLKESFLANMSLDEFARKLITAKGQNYSDGPSNFWGNYDVISTPVEIAPQASQLFLGVRLHCAQCHNHPFERWTQKDFYALAAVFAHVKGKGTKQTQEFELYLDPTEVVRHPVTDQPLPPRAPDSPEFALRPGEDVRTQFSDWLTAPENPFFARAMVNRLWKQMMGRGLVEP
ncbi:MAG: DUF1549 domain-containing protein, partial [Armatimonadetes bacterium]|nr:DUF1549 domain-containing protein [Armatimonadota bacterium]